MTNTHRIPLNPDQVVLFNDATFTPASCQKLLDFYRGFQEKNWTLFLSLRSAWAKAHPDLPLSDALCANIHPITGDFRPLPE